MTSSDGASSTTEPRPASDAEPPLHLLVLLPVLHRTPDKQRADKNEWHEQQHEHDNYEGGVDNAIFPSPALLTPGGESETRRADQECSARAVSG